MTTSVSQKSSIALTFVFTLIALIAFAANSVLCRLALGESLIDPTSFTVIRLLSGAVMLVVLQVMGKDKHSRSLFSLHQIMSWRGWFPPLMLFSYALFFSFAYIDLPTATGALILFATVQLTLLFTQWIQGHRLSKQESLGVLLSLSGFTYLMLPNASAPSWFGFLLMAIAGVSWGFYTLAGKNRSSNHTPLQSTTVNFLLCVPLCLPLLFFVDSSLFTELSDNNKAGILYAILSGALASGCGYAIWYVALRQLTITVAAISQLTVPLIAAIGGIVLVGEPLSFHLLVSGGGLLVGVGLVTIKPSLSTSD